MSDKTGVVVMLLRWAVAAGIVLSPFVPNHCFVQWEASPIERTRQVIEELKDSRAKAVEQLEGALLGGGGKED